MRLAILTLALASVAAPVAARDLPPVEERSIDDLQAMLTSGRASSVDLVKAYLARIAAMDRRGPGLRAIIALNPDALDEAKSLDAERRAGRVRGSLHGIPILVKDNIETYDPVPTTAGSLALMQNVTHRDAPVIAELRRAGAIILGKTNLSEWANIRSVRSMSGWSAVGGLVKNPYALDRTACGSSSGSGAAVAASFAAAALGTETDGSVVCPSSVNGLVGLKPSIGMVSRRYVVPISDSQDTPGPMARSVRDVAILFSAMVAVDPGDATTASAKPHDFAASLPAASLRGVRIAVLHPEMTAALAARYAAALATLRSAGAVLVDVVRSRLDGLGAAEQTVLQTELKVDLNAYLKGTPPAVAVRSLADVIAFDDAHAATEMPFFGQETFLAAQKTRGLDDPAYKAARAKSLRLAGAQGIDAMLRSANAMLLVAPSYGPGWLSDPIYGDQYEGPSSSELPAIAGYPNLTVPMGLVQGLPTGLSFVATRFGDQRVLEAGSVFERMAQARTPPAYVQSAAVGPGLEGAEDR